MPDTLFAQYQLISTAGLQLQREGEIWAPADESFFKISPLNHNPQSIINPHIIQEISKSRQEENEKERARFSPSCRSLSGL